MQNIIQIKNLSKSFKKVIKKNFLKDIFIPNIKLVNAVKDISFEIKKGESVAFLGPNGAGKTTTIKMLTGIVHPSSGEVNVLGFKPIERKKDYLMQIGLVMGSKNGLNWDLTARQSFEIFKEIYRIPKNEFIERLKMLTDLLDVEKHLDTQVRKLSLGERMKLELIGSIIHMPKILFLDEPTIGLDVIAKQKIRDFLRKVQKEFGVTILLTSHDMDDIEQVCDRVIVINHGAKIYDDTLEKLNSKYNEFKFVKCYFDSKVLNAKQSDDLKDNNINFANYEIVEKGENYYLFKVKKEKLSSLISEVQSQIEVADIDILSTPLEEIIKDLFGN